MISDERNATRNGLLVTYPLLTLKKRPSILTLDIAC